MKRIFTLSILIFIIAVLFAQDKKHIIGLSIGSAVPREDGIYINDDIGLSWPDSKISPVINLSYQYQYNAFFKLGAHLEYESSKSEVDDFLDEELKATRIVLGINYIAQYPDNKIHAELGGYFNFGMISSKDWDANLKGIEYGLICGPAMQFDKIKIALHAQPGFSYFFSKDNPEDVLLYYPRIFLKLYYTL